MAIKIAIDAGHGRYTPGKRCLNAIDPLETREWTLNSRIAEKVIAHLERCGASVLRVDDASGKTDVPLSTRSAKINQWGADYSVSIHHDSGAGGTSAGGTTVFVYSGPHSSKSDALQRAVYDCIIAACGKFGNRANPCNSANFHMVREPSCPAILVECGFMDSSIDTPMILTEAFADKCALGIARGICQTAGLAWIVDTKEEECEMTKKEIEALVDARVDAKLARLTDITGTGDNPSAWAEEATRWAIEQGIFAGDGEGNYGWQQPVTREQLAVILMAASKLP